MWQRRVRKLGTQIIGGRWLDTNKAEIGMQPDLRSRYVARESASSVRDDIFANTPALEAAKLLVSEAASGMESRTRRLMVMDIKRAFLYAHVQTET